MAQLLTLAEITGAGSVSPDEAQRRRRRFIRYQELGLLGRPVTKASRRGGEGLWHPSQAHLWHAYERHRGVVRQPTLANAPVGAWLMRLPGLELRQAQLAFDYWARAVSRVELPPAGERTDFRRRIAKAADQIAGPLADAKARRELAKMLSILSDANSMIVSRRTVEATVAAALSPSEERHPRETQYASTYYVGVDLHLLPLTHLPALRSESSTGLWTWARDMAEATFAMYQREQPILRSQPETGRFYQETPDMNYFVNQSCVTLLLLFGVGIRHLTQDHPLHIPRGMPTPDASLAYMFRTR